MSNDDRHLRAIAERAVRERAKKRSPATTDLEALTHELEVHQTELEIQNETLRLREQELEEARDRYFGLFDLAPIAYMTLDRQTNIVEANFTAAALLGCEREVLLRRKLSALVHALHADRFTLFWRRVLESGVKSSCELSLRCADGDPVAVRLEAVAAADAKGNRDEVRMAIVDLTEIRQREEQVRVTVEASPIPTLIVDRDHRIVMFNSAAEELLGYPRSEVLGELVEKLVPRDLRDAHVEHRTEYAKNPVARSMGHNRLLYARRRDGERVPVEIGLKPIETPEGPRVLTAIVDITERLRAESELRASEARFREMAERIEDVFYRLELPSGQVTYVSPACEPVFGRSAEVLTSRPGAFEELIHPDDRSRFESAFKRLLEGELFDEEYRIVTPGGETRWIRDRAFPVSEADKRVTRAIGAAQDISKRRQLEEELRHAQKMEAVGQLASGVAHDFNNLLMGIIGCAQIASRRLDKPDDARRYLDEVERAAKSGAAIAKQLNAFARKTELRPEVIRLDEIVADSVLILQRLLGEDIELAIDLGSTEYAFLDKGQLGQVLMNLAVNARDAMPDGGMLSISTRTVDRTTGDSQRKSGTRRRKWIVLEVSDTGAGMSEATRLRVFEPFFTTKRVGEGTGLGLAVVYGIVQGAGGHIEIHSAPGKGTRFEISLPAVDPPARTREEPSPDIAETAHETVLLVEDESTVRMTLRHYLSDGGYQVLEARTGDEAIEVCQSHAGSIDFLLTDMVLPGLNGPEVARKVRELEPEVRTLFMSAHAPDWLVRQGRLPAGVKSLQKPFSADELLARLAEIGRER